MRKIFFYLILCHFLVLFGQTFRLKGTVRDGLNQENIIGAQIYIRENNKGIQTDAQGNFQVDLSVGTYTLVLSYLGYQNQERIIDLKENTTLNFDLKTAEIAEIRIEDKANTMVQNTEIGVTKIDVKTLDYLPVVFGERDILKSLQLFPGINAQEGGSGFFVRGGNADQNLVLLDGIPVFNTSHQNGLLSVFHSDALENVKIYKAGLPVEYGGRLSSVTDIYSKDGNREQLHGEAGIGILTSYLTLDGPLDSAKLHSWLFSTRISYFGVFVELATDFPIKLYFADALAKFNFSAGKNDQISLMLYGGGDIIGLDQLLDLYFFNGLGALKWRHTYNEKWTSQSTFGFSNYGSDFYLFIPDGTKFNVRSGIADYLTRQEFLYQPFNDLLIKSGFDLTFRLVKPGTFKPQAGASEVLAYYKVPDKYAMEYGVFSSAEYKPLKWLAVAGGLRVSFHHRIGADKVFEFDENRVTVGETLYKKGEAFGFDYNFEPQALVNFIITPNNSIKISAERRAQYLQLIQANPTGQPTDYWFPAGGNIKPQTSEQYSIGFFNNFFKDRFETSIEFYYKNLHQQIDYIDGANTLLNEKIEAELAYGKGKAYGMEILLKKNAGKWNGWISYTLATSRRTFDEINNGKEYRAIQDRTHDLSLTLTYTPKPRHILSTVFVYYTGNSATYPIGTYALENSTALLFSDRNAYRLPDYHRLDVAYTYKWKKFAKTPRLQVSNTFSVYNVYAKKNPYLVSFEPDPQDPQKIEIVQQSLFTILPSVSFNFSF